MEIGRRGFLSVAAGAVVTGCVGRPTTTAAFDPDGRLGIASAANPHIFPLLLAMAVDPDLPVRLLPIRQSADAEPLFQSGEASAMLAMTYIGARKRASRAIPDLQLHSVTTWRGFFEVVPEGVRDFRDLQGKTVIVSGPLGSGRNGGGDVIFQAAARRQNIMPERDLRVEYMPIEQGIAQFVAGKAAGITLPSPGSTGMILRSRMGGMSGSENGPRGFSGSPTRLGLIDFQRVFTGFSSFPEGQLPLGGLHVSQRVMGSEWSRTALDRVGQAYARAVDMFMRDPEHHAPTIVESYGRLFGPLGAKAPPAMLLARSIKAGDLIYRNDIPLEGIRSDLVAWLGEVGGEALSSEFLQFGE